MTKSDKEPDPKKSAASKKKSSPTTDKELAAEIAGLPAGQVEEIITRIAREAVERVVWETVPVMVEKVLSEKSALQDQLFVQVVERAVWETLPRIAEAQVQEEIVRLRKEETKA